MSQPEVVSLELDGPIATVILNRPESMNALNFPVLFQLREAWHQIRENRDIRAVLVTGAGNRAFCAGADLKERRGMSASDVRRFITAIRQTVDELADLPHPTIAAINGVALGGGTELALGCDLRIAAGHSVMGLTEVSLGIIPGGGGTQRLPRLIGPAQAKELIFTAARIEAGKALELGLVNQMVPSQNLLAAARGLAAKICENAPVAVRQAKWAINRGLEVDLRRGLEIESEAYEFTIGTQDRLEALEAFREKRKPKFQGK